MKNYLQNGHIVRVTTPAGGIASGDALIVGSMFGIAAYSSAEGDPVDLSTAGVFQLEASNYRRFPNRQVTMRLGMA